MTGGPSLERRYRRLLACYPRRFRDEHGEELVAVLLATARDGQHRPGLIESADLVRSGLGIRLRPDCSLSARQGWSDALAAYSLAAPVLLLVSTALTGVLLPAIPEPAPGCGDVPGLARPLRHAGHRGSHHRPGDGRLAQDGAGRHRCHGRLPVARRRLVLGGHIEPLDRPERVPAGSSCADCLTWATGTAAASCTGATGPSSWQPQPRQPAWSS